MIFKLSSFLWNAFGLFFDFSCCMDFTFNRIVNSFSPSFMRYCGHKNSYGMLIPGFNRSMRCSSRPYTLQPVKKMIRPVNRVNGIFPFDASISKRWTFVAVNGWISVCDIQHSLITVKVPDTSHSMSQIIWTAYHKSFRIEPCCLYTIRKCELMFIRPGKNSPRYTQDSGNSAPVI